MYRNEYKRMNEQIVPGRDLADAVLEKAVIRQRPAFRPAVAITAMLVLAMMAVPAMATAMPWILEHVSPHLTGKLEPVQRSHTNNGITMEVVGASVKGNKAEVVVKIEGEALKAPTGVFPELRTDRNRESSGTIHSLTDYEGVEDDKNQGIYYYQVLMTYGKILPPEEPLNREITIRLGDIVTNTLAAEETEIPLILTDAEKVTLRSVADLEKRGYSTGWGDSPEYPHGCSLGKYVMQVSGEAAYDVTENLSLIAASYIDGKLRIQLRARNTYGKDNNPVWDYLGPWLTDGEGNRVESVYCNFFSTAPGEMRVEYAEYIFDIPPEELENYTLAVRLETLNTLRADCEVTFRFTEDEIMAE